MEPHHHEHNHRITSLNKAFIIGIALNISFVIVEFGVGFYYDSLACFLMPVIIWAMWQV